MLAGRREKIKGNIVQIGGLNPAQAQPVVCPLTVRPTERVDLLDKVTRNVFTLTSEISETMATDGRFKMGHHGRGKKREQIETRCVISAREGKVQLTAEHMEVYNALITHWAAGNKTVSLVMLEFALKGKEIRRIQADRKEKLKGIILDLMRTLVRIDASSEFKAYGYGEEFTVYESLIAGKYEEATINGKKVECITMHSTPILAQYAEAKNQIARYPLAALAMPVPSRDTQIITIILPYLLRRIQSARPVEGKHGHSYGLSTTILYSTIYEYIERIKPLGKSAKTEKARIRTTVRNAFAHFQSLGLITSWTERKAQRQIDALIFNL